MNLYIVCRMHKNGLHHEWMISETEWTSHFGHAERLAWSYAFDACEAMPGTWIINAATSKIEHRN